MGQVDEVEGGVRMSAPRIYTDAERKARKAAYRKRHRAENHAHLLEAERAAQAITGERAAKWRAENKERVAEYFRERYIKERADGRRQTPEAKAAAAAYYQANKDHIKAVHAAYKQANPEATRRHWHKRRARIKGCGGEFSPGIIKNLLRLQRGKCANCRRVLIAHELDHVVPLAKGGSNTDGNAQLLCPLCNRRKHAKDPIDFAQEQGRLL